MTKPGMAGEATLDEILASIRKVLDKEGPAGKGGDESVFAALAPASTHSAPLPARAAPRPAVAQGEERSPLMDRIARVVGNSAGGHGSAEAAHPAPQPPNGALEKFIESDLGDLLADAPAAEVKPAPQDMPAPPAGPATSFNPAPLWPAATTAAPAAPPAPAPVSPVRGATLPPRSEPSFAVLAEPPSARPDVKPINAPDSLGTLVPSRVDTGHGSASVASRLPPLSGAPSPADPSPFAAVRPGAPEPQGLPAFPAPPMGELGKDRLAAASWSDMMRRAEDAADAPEAAAGAPPPSGEPVVLAAMGAPRKPAAPPVQAPQQAAPQTPALAATEAAPRAPDLMAAASEPVVLAAMGPKAGSAAAKPAVDLDLPRLPRDGLQTIKPIETPAPAAAEAGGNEASPAAVPAASGIAAAEADTNTAVASALGALAAGLAASSAKPAAAAEAKPAEPAAARPAAPKAEQPDLVKGLSMAAAVRPEALPAAEVQAARSPAYVLPPLGAPAVQAKPVIAQAEISVPEAPAAAVAAPVAAPATSASDAPVPSEAFLALASTQTAPREMLPSVIGAHGMLEQDSPLDDTVAELLRPMLRQWLSDNMPRIVEKALRIELAESLKKEH